jgi:hypothetical protein
VTFSVLTSVALLAARPGVARAETEELAAEVTNPTELVPCSLRSRAADAIASRTASPVWLTLRDVPDVLHTRLALAPLTPPANAPSATMQEIRLSNGAKTAIIITAIVVGAIIVLAVIVESGGPHHPF